MHQTGDAQAHAEASWKAAGTVGEIDFGSEVIRSVLPNPGHCRQPAEQDRDYFLLQCLADTRLHLFASLVHAGDGVPSGCSCTAGHAGGLVVCTVKRKQGSLQSTRKLGSLLS